MLILKDINYRFLKNNSLIQNSIFFLILAFLFFFLGFDKMFSIGPQGIHFMRQTDSLSFASRYFNGNFNFFKPQLFNLKNIDGRAACEFPLTYYITAIFYSIIGKHLFIQRLIHLIIVYYGMYCTFKLAQFILKDFVYALLISLIVFTSTVFNYYSFNYLPDIPALGFVLAGWYFIYKYQNNNKYKTLILGFLFFTLGSLIKVTYLLNPLAIIVVSLISLIFYRKKILIPNSKKIIILGAITVIIVILWNIYIIYYNTLFNSSSFNTKALPIWILSKERIAFTWEIIHNYWYRSYFHKHAFHLIYISFFLFIIFFKRSNYKYSIQILILICGNIAYFILFYAQFQDHDYYSLAFFPLFLLLIINGFYILQKVVKNKYLHVIFKLMILIIVVLGINQSRIKLGRRFNKEVDDYSKTGLLIQSNSEAINNLNIEKDAKFLVAPDLCQNGGLFFLNKTGWNIDRPEHITIENINHYKKNGANYLLLATKDKEILSLGDSTGILVLNANGISVFKLKND